MSQIQIEKFYPYPVELVWEAITDSPSIEQWLMANDFKPIVGHKFQFRATPTKHWNGIVDGEVLEVNRPTRLAYRWIGDAGKVSTTVTWELEAHGSGTALRLLHEGFKGVGGFILSKLILGPGWRKMMGKYIPIILAHLQRNGSKYPAGTWLIPAKECDCREGARA